MPVASMSGVALCGVGEQRAGEEVAETWVVVVALVRGPAYRPQSQLEIQGCRWVLLQAALVGGWRSVRSTYLCRVDSVLS